MGAHGKARSLSARILLRRAALVFLCLPAVFCREAAHRNELRGYAFGSTYHVLLRESGDPRPGEKGFDGRLNADLQRALTTLEKSVSQWQSESDTARFNAWHRTDDFSVTSETADLLEKAFRISAATGGAFDPTLGRILELWGFTGKGFHGVPSDAELRAALSHGGVRKLSLGNGVLRKSDPMLALNLDGISQGYAADFAAAFLEERGIHIYLVEVGGEIRAGKSANGGWVVPVDAPDKKRRAVRLENNASATSARDQNYVEEAGKRFGHIIDPATGKPSDNGILQATTICSDAATADALATALLVMRESARYEARRRLKNCEFLLLTTEGNEILSPGMQKSDGEPGGQAMYWPVM